MAERPPTIEFEDIPLDQARRMSRGPPWTLNPITPSMIAGVMGDRL